MTTPSSAVQWLTSPHVTALLARYRAEDEATSEYQALRRILIKHLGSADSAVVERWIVEARTLGRVAAHHPDTRRLDKLQRLIWSEDARAGDVIGLWPCRQGGKTFIDIRPITDGADGLTADEGLALASGPDLRAAIDNLEEAR